MTTDYIACNFRYNVRAIVNTELSHFSLWQTQFQFSYMHKMFQMQVNLHNEHSKAYQMSL